MNKSVRAKLVWVFIAVQAIGEVCFWTSPHVMSSVGRYVWAAGFVLLLPGNQLAAMVIETLFWPRLSQSTMSLVAVPVEILINAVVWLACGTVVRLVWRAAKR